MTENELKNAFDIDKIYMSRYSDKFSQIEGLYRDAVEENSNLVVVRIMYNISKNTRKMQDFKEM